jgi:signal peptidase I
MSRKRKKKSERNSEKPAEAASQPTTAASTDADDTGGTDENAKGANKPGVESVRPRTPYDSLRENLEALIVAVVLAIVIRHFAVEAFEIPTGSMATTLYGMHAHFDCPNCDHDFDCGISSNSTTGEIKVRFRSMVVCDQECKDEDCTLSLHAHGPGQPGTRSLRTGSKVQCSASHGVWTGEPSSYRTTDALVRPLRCPICHHTWYAVVEADNRRGGDKILVNKYAYQLGKPKRFDVIVFGFDQWKNYIKRLIGLPGETIHVIDGDVYVDREIVRKSRDWPDVQAALWRKISDSDQIERGLNATPAWTELGEKGVQAWERIDDERWSLNNAARKEPSVFAYENKRGFDNYVAYNALAPGTQHNVEGTHAVGDMKLVFTAKPTSGSGWIGAEIRERDWTFQARLPVGSSSKTSPATLERVQNEARPQGRNGLKPAFVARDGISWRATNVEFFLPFNEDSIIEFENCDDRVVVRVDDEEVLSLEYISVPNVDAPPPAAIVAMRGIGRTTSYDHDVWLLASDVQANVRSIQLYQDVYYTPLRGFRTIKLGNGENGEERQYFAMGDNSPSSSDGRAWGFVPEKNLMGKALLVFWPALPWHAKRSSGFRWKFIR